MPSGIHKQNISVKIDKKYLDILDNIASRVDISRHKLIHDIIEMSIDQFIFDLNIGLLQIVFLIKKLSRKFARPTDAAVDEEKPDERVIPVRLSQEYLDKLDRIAKHADRKRHYVMKRFIEIGAEQLEARYEGRALITHGKVMYDLKKKLDQLCKEGQEAKELHLPEEIE